MVNLIKYICICNKTQGQKSITHLWKSINQKGRNERQTRLRLRSWWGCKRGSVRERARELELRGSWVFLELEPFGYLKEAERSKGNPNPFCCCWCWRNKIAAAKACSWIKASSKFSFSLREPDRILLHLLLVLATVAGPPGFVNLFAGLWLCFPFTGGALGTKHVQKFPIFAGACQEINKDIHMNMQIDYNYN